VPKKSDSLFLIQYDDTLAILGWDGKNQHGNSVKTGQYLLHLEVKNVYNQSTWETIERIIVMK